MPSTMPRPARRIGTSVSFLPLTRRPMVRSSGVETDASSSGRSLVASYAMSIAISSTSSLKIFVGVSRSRRMFSLCCTSGCDTTRSVGNPGVVCMARKGTNFAPMKEYQAVILRLTRHTHDDEDALTDLLNERSRGGWEPSMMTQEGGRLTICLLYTSDAADE